MLDAGSRIQDPGSKVLDLGFKQLIKVLILYVEVSFLFVWEGEGGWNILPPTVLTSCRGVVLPPPKVLRS